MVRPVYRFDIEVEYTNWGEGHFMVIEFSANPNEIAELRKPRCMMVFPDGSRQFLVQEVRRVPGKPVGGKQVIQVLTSDVLSRSNI